MSRFTPDTHALLIQQADRWLRRKCSIVITDMSHGGGETPDAIGWSGTHSILIECKASVSDFRADSLKFFRRRPENGMGQNRYFCTLRGLLAGQALPAGWGLLEWDGRKMWETEKPAHSRDFSARNEISLLISALRRIAHTAPAGVSVKCYTIESSVCRATLAVEPPEDFAI